MKFAKGVNKEKDEEVQDRRSGKLFGSAKYLVL